MGACKLCSESSEIDKEKYDMGKMTNLSFEEAVNNRSQTEYLGITSFCCIIGGKGLEIAEFDTINTTSTAA